MRVRKDHNVDVYDVKTQLETMRLPPKIDGLVITINGTQLELTKAEWHRILDLAELGRSVGGQR